MHTLPNSTCMLMINTLLQNFYIMEEFNEARDMLYDIEIHDLLADAIEEDRPVARRPRYIVAGENIENVLYCTIPVITVIISILFLWCHPLLNIFIDLLYISQLQLKL